MLQDDGTRLQVLTAARQAVAFMADADLPTFCNDDKTQSAVLHQLLVFGEAVKRLSDDFRMKNPDIPWK